ncbi:MAG: hypothetical protein JWQ18_1634 [Conexibacter sp.]|nr:hypothetical protein [Conexibacter sp.]
MSDFHQADEQPSSTRDYRLSPRKVAMWSAIAAVAAVAALIAVAAVNDADALNTVALYLAVIAFVAQLIMYVAQNESSARQLKQSQDVQRQTSTMLRGIQEQAGGMQRLMNEQYGLVINALVERATEATAAVAGGRLPAEQESFEVDVTTAPEGDGDDQPVPLTQEALDELREDLRAEFTQTAVATMARFAEQQQAAAWPAAEVPTSGALGPVSFPLTSAVDFGGPDPDGFVFIGGTADRRAAMERAKQRRREEEIRAEARQAALDELGGPPIGEAPKD